MAGSYAYTPHIWLPLIATILMAALATYCWRRRSMPVALSLLAFSLFSALYLLGATLEATASTPATKFAWFKFEHAWLIPMVSAEMCFVLEYVYPGRWLTRRNLSLLALPPLLNVSLLVANDGRLLWRWLEIGPDGWVVGSFASLGAILMAYGVGLILVNAVAFRRRSPMRASMRVRAR